MPILQKNADFKKYNSFGKLIHKYILSSPFRKSYLSANMNMKMKNKQKNVILAIFAILGPP